MKTEIKVAKLQMDKDLAIAGLKTAKDVGVAILSNPVTGIVIGYVSIKAMRKLNWISGPEEALLAGVVTSAGMLGALKPVIPLLGNRE